MHVRRLASRRRKRCPRPETVTRVELTNQDKVYWPEDGFTKGDLIRFYDRIAPVLVPHLLDRPLVFDRYPNGIHGEHFYQKDAHDYTPDWIRTQKIWSPDVERHIRYFIGADRDQLLYIANMGAIAQNPWSSRVQFIERPDYVIFDLDPVDAPYSVVQQVALALKSVLDELHLRAYPKTSGASGIHVYLPILENRFSYEDVRVFAEAIARVVVQGVPEIATVERVVRKRKTGTVYVDYLQNVKGKTVASVYSPRAVPGACVSTPLKWEEFKKPLNPRDYTIKNGLQAHRQIRRPVRAGAYGSPGHIRIPEGTSKVGPRFANCRISPDCVTFCFYSQHACLKMFPNIARISTPVNWSAQDLHFLEAFATNPRGIISVLRNLPPEITGALCSRASRASGSLLEVLLKEYLYPIVNGDDPVVAKELEETVAFLKDHGFKNILNNQRAQAFYSKWLSQYGDDSIAQITGTHVIVWGISQVAMKFIEDQRVGLEPIEKSTRYVNFGSKVGGRYLYYIPRPDLERCGLLAEYIAGDGSSVRYLRVSFSARCRPG